MMVEISAIPSNSWNTIFKKEINASTSDASITKVAVNCTSLAIAVDGCSDCDGTMEGLFESEGTEEGETVTEGLRLGT